MRNANCEKKQGEFDASRNRGGILGMATLDRILQLKQQGFSEAQIVQQLQNEGILPFEISDAMSQAQIKEAVGQNSPSQMQMPEPYDMQGSITDATATGQFQNQPAEIPIPETPTPEAPEYSEEQYYSPSQSPYYEEQYPQAQAGYSQETTTELAEQIAEQIVLEKFNEFQQKTGDKSGYN